MIAYLKGILSAVHPTHVVVDVHGIGYSVMIHCRLIANLPAIGLEVKFYTSFVVREFSHTLYGFFTNEERDVFEVLMNVTGIGPKLALSLIGHLTFSEMQTALIQQDLKTLCRVPGVGKKTAERLIVELKDKLSSLNPMNASTLAISLSEKENHNVQDAILALLNLGYNQYNAQKAIKQSLKDLPENADLALLITSALKHI